MISVGHMESFDIVSIIFLFGRKEVENLESLLGRGDDYFTILDQIEAQKADA